MDQMQAFRMIFIWPIIMFSGGFFTSISIARLVVKDEVRAIITSLKVGFGCWIAGLFIGFFWNNGPHYWLSFTIGLTGLAVVLLCTVFYYVREHV